MKPYFKHKRRKNIIKYLRAIFALISLVFLFAILDNYIKPVVSSMSQTKVKIVATEEINKAILQAFVSDPKYSNIALIERDSSNRISSVSLDTIKANEIKAKISQTIISSFNSNIKDLSIPVGTLTGFIFLNERGFYVPLKISFASNPDINFESKFESAGMNQSKHTIYINVTMDINIYIKPYNTKTQVSTNIPVSETIIVGEVPSFYSNLSSTH